MQMMLSTNLSCAAGMMLPATQKKPVGLEALSGVDSVTFESAYHLMTAETCEWSEGRSCNLENPGLAIWKRLCLSAC